ncbi:MULTISPECIES: ATP-binding cassette domain-containing protein [unclassified Nocardioides]|uniref:ATP-binding cassette domain-containing protein n=1 Tax=unclassified Nocardioides TaxID=2615069 RepID=UPI0006FDED8F|nr:MULTISPECIES: ATP-binding cassette domain-containing protein [unclassified Nocardioides]KRA28136.1 urea ABC transporter ATP-binding subunit UrtE [Nocardioides sp. Root614]KRA86110.1 urea ABC transporter ATP-binding subunit UrtE [Nocardioides sp. Root682]
MLELRDVTAGYGRTRVLENVSIEVPEGGAVAIMGHNGAGKTTLLRVAVGLLPVMSGQVLLDGEDVTRLRPNKRVRRGVGYVPQGQLCFPQMTTLENLQLVSTDRVEIDGVLGTFPALVELLSRRAGLLSGGQRQQLAIARTLLTKPRLLILDEPTEGIQPNVVAEIEAVIAALTTRGDLSVLLVEQHVGFALRSTGSYYVLESGRITSNGTGGAGALEAVRAAMAV